MESPQAEMKRQAAALDMAFQHGVNTCYLPIEALLERQLHHDFATNRIIHGVIESILESFKPLTELTPYKDAVDAQLGQTPVE